MITLAMLSCLTQDCNLTIHTHLEQVTCTMIPGLDPGELVDIYQIREHLDDPRVISAIDIMVVVRESGDVYVMGIMESSRMRGWRFLTDDQYRFYSETILPLYGIGNVPSYVSRPYNFVQNANEGNLREFYYVDHVQPIAILGGQEIVENLITTAIGDMVYYLTTYRTLMNGHWDRGVNSWASDYQDLRMINGSKCDILEVNHGVAWVNYLPWSRGFIYYKGKAYYGLSSLDVSNGIRNALDEPTTKLNDRALAPYMDFWNRSGIDVDMLIINETTRGPLATIATLMQQYSEQPCNPKRFDFLVLVVSSIDSDNQTVNAMANVFNIINAKRWTEVGLQVARTKPVVELTHEKPEPIDFLDPELADQGVDILRLLTEQLTKSFPGIDIEIFEPAKPKPVTAKTKPTVADINDFFEPSIKPS